MGTLTFKTNIKCSGCIETVTPFLNNLSEIEKWEVDTASPDKILTVQGDESLNDQKVISLLEQAGYKAEKA
ncbi:heavy-metal-associated domain-containing protein [Olivibacter sp. SDN3]|uniref:HMA domain-containing protein n=1 Tax=Sphingobacterium sp. (strain 21) TaxID=743722 RepID=F4C150_SPHS2|nr:heavy-metal-associated domain-containing protein [Olivibacter sp. SDN3]MDX3916862.1 heavy-metal-associated domain-containing protein [Pseudosphingobacterium sp.]QNL50316.1 heavy-metal-associated domain-containing protein [Olivibacter sp. SDN3]